MSWIAHLTRDVTRIAGAGMGFLFGMFLGAMGDMQPISMINGREVPQPPLREQVHNFEIRMVMLSSWANSVLVVCLCATNIVL
jgi:hypothetical protein